VNCFAQFVPPHMSGRPASIGPGRVAAAVWASGQARALRFGRPCPESNAGSSVTEHAVVARSSCRLLWDISVPSESFAIT